MQDRTVLPLLTLFVCALALPASATQYTVGPQVFCDFNNLATALAAANGGDVLYISSEVIWDAPPGGFQINGKSLSLIGTTSCDQDPEGFTTLRGDGSSSVLEISGSGITVSLWHMQVTGGGSDSDHGGGVEVRGDVDLYLAESHVSNNSSDLGGGIYFEGAQGAGLFINDAVGVQSNSANSGGGIYCTGEVSIQFNSGSISVNNAEHGGGIWLGGGCGISIDDGGIFLGVTFNDATGDGGGIYAEGNSTVILQPGASVTANEATRGGGIFISGEGSLLQARNAQVSGNTAAGDGGAIFAELGADIRFEGPLDASGLNQGCRLDPPRCALFTGNAAGSTGAGSGGALYATSGASVRVQQAFVENNSAAGAASVFHLSGSGTQLQLGRSFVTESSGGAAVIRATNGANVWVVHTTFSRNHDHSGVFNAASGSMNLSNSIIWESSGTVVTSSGAGVGPVANCLLVHESASLAPFATDVSVQDPLFVSAATGDYHLQTSSPGIDRCPDSSAFWLNELDVDGDILQDDPATANLSGIADAGGDEVGGTIFTDGFESGDTSGWSASMP